MENIEEGPAAALPHSDEVSLDQQHQPVEQGERFLTVQTGDSGSTVTVEETSSSGVTDAANSNVLDASLVTQSVGEVSREGTLIAAAPALPTRRAIPIFAPLDDGYAVVCLVTNEEKEVLRRCWVGPTPATVISTGAAGEGRLSIAHHQAQQQLQPVGAGVQSGSQSAESFPSTHSQVAKGTTGAAPTPQPLPKAQPSASTVAASTFAAPASVPSAARPAVATTTTTQPAAGRGLATPARAPMPILIPKQGLPPGFSPVGLPTPVAMNRHAAELGATPRTNDPRYRSSNGSRSSGAPSTTQSQVQPPLPPPPPPPAPPGRHPLPAEPLPILIPLGVAEKAGSDPVFARLLVERARMSACKDRRIRPVGRSDAAETPAAGPKPPPSAGQATASPSVATAVAVPTTKTNGVHPSSASSAPAAHAPVSQGSPSTSATGARPDTQSGSASLPQPGARLVAAQASPPPQPHPADLSSVPITPQPHVAPAAVPSTSGVSTVMGLPPPGARLHTTPAPAPANPAAPAPKHSAPAVTQILQHARPPVATPTPAAPAQTLPRPGAVIYPAGVKPLLPVPTAALATSRPVASQGVGGPVARTQAQPDQPRPFNPAAQLTRGFVQATGTAAPLRRPTGTSGQQWVPPHRVLSAPSQSQSFHGGGQFQSNSMMNFRDRRKRTRSITPDHQRPHNPQRQPQAGHRRFNPHDPVAISLKKDVPKGYVIVFDTSLLLDLTCSELTALVFDNKLVFPYKVVQELDDHHHNRGRPEIRQQALMVRDWLYEALDTHLVDEHIRLQGRDEIPAIHEKTASSSDDHILGCAAFFAQRYKGKIPVILATRDKFMAIKAKGERGLALRVVGYHELLQWVEPKDEKKSKRDDK
jgi:hypothetical protein